MKTYTKSYEQYGKAYYQTHKEEMDAKSIAYAKNPKNRKRITERNRVLRWEKKGLVVPQLEYSFYRDTLEKLSYDDPLWNKLFALKLTDHQRELLDLIRYGYSQQEISAMYNSTNNSTVCKAVNGNLVYFEDGSIKRYGGIHRKANKAGIL